MDKTIHFDAFRYMGTEYEGSYSVCLRGDDDGSDQIFVGKGQEIRVRDCATEGDCVGRSEQAEIAMAHWAECGAEMAAD